MYNYYLRLGVRDMSEVFTLICQVINTLTDSADRASGPFLALCPSLHIECQLFRLLSNSTLNVTGNSAEAAL